MSAKTANLMSLNRKNKFYLANKERYEKGLITLMITIRRLETNDICLCSISSLEFTLGYLEEEENYELCSVAKKALELKKSHLN